MWRAGNQAVWTGTEMIVWGGFGGHGVPIDSVLHDHVAVAYHPGTDRWRGLASVPEPWSGDDGPAVSLSDAPRMLVWRRGSLGAYDMTANAWANLGTPSFPPSNCGSTAGPTSVATTAANKVLVWTGGCEAVNGAAYEPSTKRWERIADAPVPILSVASADEVVYAATAKDDVSRVDLSRYSVEEDSWSVLPPAPIPLGQLPFVVWTGREVLVWGGYAVHGDPPTGAAYTA